MNTKRLKLAAATAGVGGVLAMGALTTFGGTSLAEPPPEPPPPGPVTTTAVTLPETSTETTAPTTPTTTEAVPEITGPAPLPPEQEGAL